ncbi:hypothetical protein CAPTEDRAFT_223249 [Capitella teleta]|uniref:CUB domain-containing protein n=1 Tax=Capitella teleta TaxID=283909 RepID=R7T3D2_CAPTE|nr:hypothetical protein CAPTEDRAFT_223249 [Capitella teleta]|eukprot:ELT87111.1 hypothetical protein CAPTEDRAFT_223249 [Capitella teleta]
MEHGTAGLWSLILSFVCLPHCVTVGIRIKEVTQETCSFETSSLRCSSHQTIFVTKSFYGHMKGFPDLAQIDNCAGLVVDRQLKYAISTQIEQHCIYQSQPFRVTVPSSLDIEISITVINEAELDNDEVELTISDMHGNITNIDVSRSRPTLQQLVKSRTIHLTFEPSEVIMLFSFKAVGCEDFVAPEFTWIERNRNTITIGCIHNEYTWQVMCIGSKWIGFRGNCTRQIEAKPADETPVEAEKDITPTQTIFTKGIQYALTIGITVLLCVVVITTGFVCLRKAEYKAKASKGLELQEMTGDYSNTWKATLMRPVTNDLNNPNASPPQQFYVLNQQNDTPIATLR